MMKRCESVTSLCQSFLERLVSKTYACMLWDAEKGSGIFNPQNVPEKSLNGLSPGEYKENMDYIQNGLRIYRQSIGDKMKEFIRSKEELLEEIIKLDNYIEMVILTRMPAAFILNALIIMQSVILLVKNRRT